MPEYQLVYGPFNKLSRTRLHMRRWAESGPVLFAAHATHFVGTHSRQLPAIP